MTKCTDADNRATLQSSRRHSKFVNSRLKQAVFGGIVLLLSAGANAQQIEGEAACEEPGVTNLVYGDHTVGCSISTGADVDNLQFSGETGDRVRIVIQSTSSSAYDPRIEFFDCGFNLIEEVSCINNGCTAFIDTALTCTGTHTLFVSDLGSNEGGNYTVQLERILPPHEQTAMPYGTVFSDVISPATDIDRYYFNAVVGTRVRLAIDSTTSSAYDPRVEILDPTGEAVLDRNCQNNGCTFTEEFEPAVDGLYSVIISDFSSNEAGGYDLAIHCIFGPCDSDGDATPDAPPPALAYDLPASAVISPGVDMESFQFDVVNGTALRIAVHSTTSSAFDPSVEIYDSSGALMASGSCTNNGCTFTVGLDIVADDTLTALITDIDVNDGGGFDINLQCLTGPCDGDADGTPDSADSEAAYVFYDGSFDDVVTPGVDMVPLYFHGAANTVIRIAVDSTTSSAFDPLIEIFAPDGAAFYAQSCSNNGCSFAADLSLPQDGVYTAFLSDVGVNDGGGYDFHLQCLTGPCDADADGVLDGDPVIVPADIFTSNIITPGVDVDQFAFLGEPGTLIRITLDSTTSSAYDPRLELIEPDGTLTEQSCTNNGCFFTIDFSPTQGGLHTLRISDLGSNDGGGYDLTLQCLSANCSAPPAPPTDRDNCEWIVNGSLLPDDGGNVQRDTNMDGYGNVCDPDLNNDGDVNFLDLGALKEVFFSTDEDADFNGDGVVNFIDLGRMKQLFFGPPGPSGQQCAGTVPCP